VNYTALHTTIQRYNRYDDTLSALQCKRVIIVITNDIHCLDDDAGIVNAVSGVISHG